MPKVWTRVLRTHVAIRRFDYILLLSKHTDRKLYSTLILAIAIAGDHNTYPFMASHPFCERALHVQFCCNTGVAANDLIPAVTEYIVQAKDMCALQPQVKLFTTC